MQKKLFIFFLVFLFFNSAFAQKSQTKNYTQTISGSDLTIDMVAIPAGEFKRGSTKNMDEKPIHNVKINTFWMAKLEITWDVYYLYLNREIDDKKNV